MTVSGRLQDEQRQRLMHLIDECRDLFLCGSEELWSVECGLSPN